MLPTYKVVDRALLEFFGGVKSKSGSGNIQEDRDGKDRGDLERNPAAA
jgi:hypothetical protein